MNTPGSRKCSLRRMRSPSRAPWVNGEEGSIESTATSRSRARACSIRRPISVDLPTPGGPVNPTTAARPVLGYTSRTSAQPSGSSFSTSEMARASARLSPSSRRWARSAAVLPGVATAARRLVPAHLPHPNAAHRAARVPRGVLPRQVQVVAPAVPLIPVVSHPPQGRARPVLPRLGPAGQAIHVVPRAARTGIEVNGQAQRVLSVSLVPVHGVTVPDAHVVAADEIEHVAEDAAVHPRAALPGDGHEEA